MTADELVDYLTMMVWGGIAGIARVEGSVSRFVWEPRSLVCRGGGHLETVNALHESAHPVR